MNSLPDDHGRIELFRALSGVLSVAIVLALVEVLIQFNTYDGVVKAPQLAMAAFANIGVLGAVALVVVGAGWVMGSVVAIPAGRYRRGVKVAFMSAFPGLSAGVLTWWTRVFGLVPRGDDPYVLYAITGFIALVVGLMVWHIAFSRDASLMNLTRFLVVVAWVTCAAGGVVGANKTLRYADAWSHVDEAAEIVQAVPDSPNLLLVVLDTLRADKVGVYGESQLTPNLDRLAESSYVYETAISTAPWTLPTHASLLTGLYPETHGVNWGHYELNNEWTTLGELVGDRGYDTFAVSSNWLLNEENGFARGFDTFIETTRDPYVSRWRLALRCGAVSALAQRLGLSRDAGWDQGSAFTNALLAKRFSQQAKSGRPFFALVNYFEPHDPYQPPERFLETHLTRQERAAAMRLHQSEEKLAACACGLSGVFDEQDVALMERLYDAEVAYQDEVVGDLVTMLEREDLLKNTWLVVTSDHGELFGEWDMVYHTAGAHFNLLHVPLIVRPPGGTEMTRIASPVQPVDVFVTLAQKAGAVVPSGVTRAYPLPMDADAGGERQLCVAQTHGASLAGLSMTQRQSLQIDLTRWMRWLDSVYTDGFLLEMDSQGGRRLYDVAGDPDMVTDVSGDQMGQVFSMEKRFARWSGRANDRVSSRR